MQQRSVARWHRYRPGLMVLSTMCVSRGAGWKAQRCRLPTIRHSGTTGLQKSPGLRRTPQSPQSTIPPQPHRSRVHTQGRCHQSSPQRQPMGRRRHQTHRHRHQCQLQQDWAQQRHRGLRAFPTLQATQSGPLGTSQQSHQVKTKCSLSHT